MSMWYDRDGVLILNDSVCPAFTLICVANPWIVESPAPLTCQSPGGSPGFVFSHAITLVTGGPHGPAAAAGRASTRKSKPRSTTSIRPITERRPEVHRRKCPVSDMLGAPRRMSPYFSLRKGDAPPGRVGWQDLDNKMITINHAAAAGISP